MSDISTLQPELTLVPCLALEPRSLTGLPEMTGDFEFGALGVGTVQLDNGQEALALSIHEVDGGARIAVLSVDDCLRLLPLLGEALPAPDSNSGPDATYN